MDKMAFHKIVRGVSRRPDIAYEYVSGDVEYDEIEDPLPFDIDAPVIEIGDDDYALWNTATSPEETKKYDGKTVEYKGPCRGEPAHEAGHVLFRPPAHDVLRRGHPVRRPF